MRRRGARSSTVVIEDAALHPVDACGEHLATNRCLQVQEGVEVARLGEHRRQEDLVVRAQEADHAAVPLHDPLRVPGHVVADDRLRLLEVLALGEHVGGEQQVDLAVGRLVSGPDDGVGAEATRAAACAGRVARGADDHGHALAAADAVRAGARRGTRSCRRRSRTRRSSRPGIPRAARAAARASGRSRRQAPRAASRIAASSSRSRGDARRRTRDRSRAMGQRMPSPSSARPTHAAMPASSISVRGCLPKRLARRHDARVLPGRRGTRRAPRSSARPSAGTPPSTTRTASAPATGAAPPSVTSDAPPRH